MFERSFGLASGRTPAAIVGAIAIILGCAAIYYAANRKTTGGLSEVQAAAMASAMNQLNGALKETRGKIEERATTLSRLLAVKAAIATDVATVAILVDRGDFLPANGETLELGRINKANHNAVEQLTLQPKGAMSTSHDGMTGSYAELVGGQVLITEVAKVDPTEKDDQYAGFLSVTRTLALGPAIQSLADAGITGTFVINGKETPIGVVPAGATMREQRLSAPDGAKILVGEPPPHAILPVPILVGGIGTAMIGLLLIVMSLRSKRNVAGTSLHRFNA